MKSLDPVVSVLMTAYNREKYIGEAISSVLASSFEDFELIIVDDCSEDTTVEIAQDYAAQDSRIRLFQNQKNVGDYPNRNMAASFARGKYLKYLDSDNVIYRFGLDSMVDCMERFPAAGYGLLSESDPSQPYPVCVSPREAYFENFFGTFGYFGRAPDSAIIRRSAFSEVGGFTGKNLIGDLEMWMRLSQHFWTVKLPPYLGWDRVHDEQQKNVDPVEYQKMRNQIVHLYLTSPDCPLSKCESANALKLSKKRQRRQAYRLLARGQIQLGVRLLVSAFHNR